MDPLVKALYRIQIPKNSYLIYFHGRPLVLDDVGFESISDAQKALCAYTQYILNADEKEANKIIDEMIESDIIEIKQERFK